VIENLVTILAIKFKNNLQLITTDSDHIFQLLILVII